MSTAPASPSAEQPQGGFQGRPRKESAIELNKYLEKVIRVKFQGGREVAGVLKGFDPIVNLVLDNAVEYLRDPNDPYLLTGATRQIGLTVCRGVAVTSIFSVDGFEEIANPFAQPE
ncbi:putative U6 snRNA-associated Sm protein LSm7 [Paratrimastix pyriformis]|uniref:U6 snRNA-associated Sm protein LSm7 n=1 Tax=Paratrimastix pyriformis TaxID=342808 RepID=A0ABQ8UQI8_9EUKA|nr:putative U6 snRNA-associated Sm protein LSm7 [Paratrimastix pyriformis]|eukprot:EC838273.1.p2 GENE.EC838273.1~~EC838273.1.p2  ORF type:complete len:116 (+),score=12.56 EC838273.1:94-441(+)